MLLKQLAEVALDCGGDFNEILSPQDKLGGIGRHTTAMSQFRSCLDICGLQDLQWQGYLFTCCNQ